jgi:hypothetical protein
VVRALLAANSCFRIAVNYNHPLDSVGLSKIVIEAEIAFLSQFVEQLDITENSLFSEKSMRFKSGDPLDIFFIQNGNFFKIK